MASPDEIFARTQDLRAQIDAASAAGDSVLVGRLKSEQEALKREARIASINVEASQLELVVHRKALAAMSQKKRRGSKLRSLFGGVGSPERVGIDDAPAASGLGLVDEKERLVARITELEEELLLVDALHIKQLTPNTVTDWN